MDDDDTLQFRVQHEQVYDGTQTDDDDDECPCMCCGIPVPSYRQVCSEKCGADFIDKLSMPQPAPPPIRRQAANGADAELHHISGPPVHDTNTATKTSDEPV